MAVLDHTSGENDGLNNPEVRARFRDDKESWETEGCLPPDESPAFIKSFVADVRTGRIAKDELQQVIDNAREALNETKAGAMRLLLQDVLRAAGVPESEIGV